MLSVAVKGFFTKKPKLGPLTLVDRMNLDILQKRIDQEVADAALEKQIYDDIVEATMKEADEHKSTGDTRRQCEMLFKAETRMGMRKNTHNAHLNRLRDLKLQYENLRQGREL